MKASNFFYKPKNNIFVQYYIAIWPVDLLMAMLKLLFLVTSIFLHLDLDFSIIFQSKMFHNLAEEYLVSDKIKTSKWFKLVENSSLKTIYIRDDKISPFTVAE